MLNGWDSLLLAIRSFFTTPMETSSAGVVPFETLVDNVLERTKTELDKLPGDTNN
jgi:hypothetical protein